MNQTVPFSLAPGGPVDRLLAKRLAKPPGHPRLGLRAVIAAALAWLPLFLMAVINPNPNADVSFLHDVAVHVRLLVCIPLLVLAEGVIGYRSQLVVTEFLASGLVRDEDASRYEATMRQARRLLDSWLAEVVIIVLSALLVYTVMHTLASESSVFWFEHHTRLGGQALSPAGWWYAVVSTPMFVFLLLRWIWRYLLWMWFLGRVARLDLRLTGSHPDRMGGLGFVTFNHTVFSVLVFAFASVVSAAAATRILNFDASLKEYQQLLVILGIVSVLFGVAPLLVFTPRLVQTKRGNWLRYTRFASDYVMRYEQKWLGADGSKEDMLGSGDIQSLADLGGGFDRMVEMKPVAIDRRLLLSFLLAAVIPALPLVLTIISFRELVKTVLTALM